jgi:hypothetical protein
MQRLRRTTCAFLILAFQVGAGAWARPHEVTDACAHVLREPSIVRGGLYRRVPDTFWKKREA